MTKRHDPRAIWRLLAWGAVALVLAWAFALYLRPDFMLDVANQLWSCF